MPNSLVGQPGVSEGHQLFSRKYQVSLRVMFWGCTQCRLYLLGTQRIPEPCRGGHSHTGPCPCDQPSALSVRLSLQSASPTGRRSAPRPLWCPRTHRALSVLPVSGKQSHKITRGCSLLTSELPPGGRRRTPTLGLWGVWGTTKGPLRPRKPVPGGRGPSGKQSNKLRRKQRSSRPGCFRGRGAAGPWAFAAGPWAFAAGPWAFAAGRPPAWRDRGDRRSRELRVKVQNQAARGGLCRRAPRGPGTQTDLRIPPTHQEAPACCPSPGHFRKRCPGGQVARLTEHRASASAFFSGSFLQSPHCRGRPQTGDKNLVLPTGFLLPLETPGHHLPLAARPGQGLPGGPQAGQCLTQGDILGFTTGAGRS